jgi:uncharacterized protein YkwD
MQLPPPLISVSATKHAVPRVSSDRLTSEPTAADLLVERVNMIRATYYVEQGGAELPPLKLSQLLNDAANAHSQRMADANFIAHCDLSNQDTLWSRLAAAGYSCDAAGEIIAAGYLTAQDLFGALSSSAGHYQHMVGIDYRELGVGHASDPGELANVRFDRDRDCVADSFGNGPYDEYWTLNFGLRAAAFHAIVVINREAYQTRDNTVGLYIYGEEWATEMRLCNEDGTWTSWQPFSSEVEWELSPGTGIKTVSVEIRNATPVTRAAQDTIISIEGLNIIFSNGFETGDFSGWSWVQS